MVKKYLAEFVGTFALSFVVLLAVAGGAPIAIPVIAGLTLGLFVYSIGSISGCHINPAVTLGLLSIKKISPKDASFYVVAQLVGALVAVMVAGTFSISSGISGEEFSFAIFLAEVIGTLFFAFGIASVVYGKVSNSMSGLVVGGSLLFGILIASMAGSLGILNPAVALALNSLTTLYLFAPVVGSIAGFHLYKYLASE